MEHRHHRFFLVTQSDKIKKWINDMSSKGLQLDRTEGYGTFVFRDGAVGEYQYDVQLMHKAERRNSNDNGYFDFLRDMDIEVLTSKTDVVVFKRSSKYGELSLYNDPTPYLKYLKRVRWPSYVIVAMMVFQSVHFTYRYFESLSQHREMQILIDQIYEEQGILLQNFEPIPLLFVVPFLIFGSGISIGVVSMIELKIHRLKKEIPEDSADGKKVFFEKFSHKKVT